MVGLRGGETGVTLGGGYPPQPGEDRVRKMPFRASENGVAVLVWCFGLGAA